MAFHTYVVRRGIIAERGLVPDANSQRELTHGIIKKGWGRLARHLEVAVVHIVRQFYANMVEGSISSFVRGRADPFDSASINRYYGLPNLERDG